MSWLLLCCRSPACLTIETNTWKQRKTRNLKVKLGVKLQKLHERTKVGWHSASGILILELENCCAVEPNAARIWRYGCQSTRAVEIIVSVHIRQLISILLSSTSSLLRLQGWKGERLAHSSLHLLPHPKLAHGPPSAHPRRPSQHAHPRLNIVVYCQNHILCIRKLARGSGDLVFRFLVLDEKLASVLRQLCPSSILLKPSTIKLELQSNVCGIGVWI